jgi:hypothetical protein
MKSVSFVMPEFTSKSSSNLIAHTSSISSLSSSSTPTTTTTTKLSSVASTQLNDMKKRVEMIKKRKAYEEESL